MSAGNGPFPIPGGSGSPTTWSQYPATNTITGIASQALTIASVSNQNIVLSPSGTGSVNVNSNAISLSGQYTQAQGNMAISVLNTDQTNGDAIVAVVTDSVTGDAYTNYLLGDSTTLCSTGLDNSDGKSYKISFGISPGINDRFVINPATTGQVNALAALLSAQYSNAGGNVTVGALNSSAAANSNALFGLSVNGASAGDPFIQYAVGGVQTWSTGVDNSDSDAFKISASAALGTSDLFSLKTSGEANCGWATLLTPAVSVNMNTSATTALYTVPAGKSARILAVLSTVTTAITGAPTNSVGVTPAFTNIVANTNVPATPANTISVAQTMATASPQFLVLPAGSVISVVIGNTGGVTGVVLYQLRIELF